MSLLDDYRKHQQGGGGTAAPETAPRGSGLVDLYRQHSKDSSVPATPDGGQPVQEAPSSVQPGDGAPLGIGMRELPAKKPELQISFDPSKVPEEAPGIQAPAPDPGIQTNKPRITPQEPAKPEPEAPKPDAIGKPTVREDKISLSEQFTRAVTGEPFGAKGLNPIQGTLAYLSPVAQSVKRADLAKAHGRLNFGISKDDAQIEEPDVFFKERYTMGVKDWSDNDLALAVYNKNIGPEMDFDRKTAIKLLMQKDVDTIESLQAFDQEVARRPSTLWTKGVMGAVDMVPYMLKISTKGVGVLMEAATQFEERRAGKGEVDPETGEYIVTQGGADVLESLGKGVFSAAGEYLIETKSGAALKYLGGKGPIALAKMKFLSSSGRRGAVRYAKELAKKLKSKVPMSKAMASVSKTFGFGNLFEEIVVEEGVQAIYDAALNLNNQVDQDGKPLGFWAREAQAIQGFVQSVPEMIISFGLFGVGRHGVNTAKYHSHRAEQKKYLKELGVDDGRIEAIQAEEDGKERGRMLTDTINTVTIQNLSHMSQVGDDLAAGTHPLVKIMGVEKPADAEGGALPSTTGDTAAELNAREEAGEDVPDVAPVEDEDEDEPPLPVEASEEEVYSRKPKPLPKSKSGDLAARAEYDREYAEWRKEYGAAIKKTELEKANQEVEPAPTEAQIEAGNYKKAHIKINGMDISIENPIGSERSGTSPEGDKWSQKMANSYGYIKRTEGADGDQVDVFINDAAPEGSEDAFIINQVNPKTGEFDEHKVMLGFDDAAEAAAAYEDNYETNWKGLGSIEHMSMDEFKEWLASDKPKNSKPATAVAKTKEDEDVNKRTTGEPKGKGRGSSKGDGEGGLEPVHGEGQGPGEPEGGVRGPTDGEIEDDKKPGAGKKTAPEKLQTTLDKKFKIGDRIKNGPRKGTIVAIMDQGRSVSVEVDGVPGRLSMRYDMIEMDDPKAPAPFVPAPKAEESDEHQALSEKYGGVNPKSIRLILEAIKTKDAAKLKDFLHLGNKNLRKLFKDQTGVKLPPREGLTKTAIDEWAAEKPKDLKTEKPKKKAPEGKTLVGKPAGKEIVPNIKKGVKNWNKGLNEIFGKGKLGMLGMTFDEDDYQKAKPYFAQGLKDFQEAGKGIKEFFQWAISSWGDQIKPYLKRFKDDLGKGLTTDGRDDTVSTEQAELAGMSDDDFDAMFDEAAAETKSEWVAKKPITKPGRKVFNRISSDKAGRKFGVWSIVDLINDKFGVELRVGPDQISQKHPARYERDPHIVRSEAGGAAMNFHEGGHAMCRNLIEADRNWMRGHGAEFIAIAEMPESMASAENASEGVAEWVRRYIVDYPSVANLPVTAFMEKYLAENQPEYLDTLQDAVRAFGAHLSRTPAAQMLSFSSEAERHVGDGVFEASTLEWLGYTVSSGHPLQHIEDKMFKAIRKGASKRKQGLKLAREWRDKNWRRVQLARQSVLNIPAEVQTILQGTKKGRHGVRMLSADGSKYKYFSDKSMKDIIKMIPRGKWNLFQSAGWARTALSRYEAKGLLYPGSDAGITPAQLKEIVKTAKNQIPNFDKAYQSVTDFANGLLDLAVFVGEKTEEDADRMKGAYEYYWPLPKYAEGQVRKFGRSLSKVKPSSGFYRAFGSLKGNIPLLTAIEDMTSRVLSTAYNNRGMLSIADSAAKTALDKSLPAEARWQAGRVAVRLAPDVEIAATATVDEMNQIAADAINKIAEEDKGSPLEDGEKIKPDEISVFTKGQKLWRITDPKAVHVIAPFRDGKREFYQIKDPVLYHMFAGAQDPGSFFRWYNKVFLPVTRPWKRLLTQNLVFAIGNSISRDPANAVLMGPGKEGAAKYIYLTTGLLNRLTGKHTGARQVGELFSKSLDATTSANHKLLRNSLWKMLVEDIAIDGFKMLPKREQAAAIPGILSGILAKPGDILNFLSLGRFLSEHGEQLSREGQYIWAEKKGLGQEEANYAYHVYQGNFGERSGFGDVAAAIAPGGFINAGLRFTYQHYQRLFNVDPAIKRSGMARLFMLSLYAALGWVVKELMSDPDDEKRQKERSEEDRAGYMDIKGLRIPFDYGIPGAVESTIWNILDDQVAGLKVQDRKKAAKQIAKRVFDVPGNPVSMFQPFIKSVVEASVNKNIYWGNYIVPPWMEKKYRRTPEDQYFPSTPTLYRAMGEMIGKSPLKIRHVVKNGLNRQLDEIVTLLDGKKKIEGKSDLPIVGRLFIKNPAGWYSASVKSLEKLDDEYKGVKERIDKMKEEGRNIPRSLQVQIDHLDNFHDAMLDVQYWWKQTKTAGSVYKEQQMKQRMVRRAQDAMMNKRAAKGYARPNKSFNPD